MVSVPQPYSWLAKMSTASHAAVLALITGKKVSKPHRFIVSGAMTFMFSGFMAALRYGIHVVNCAAEYDVVPLMPQLSGSFSAETA